MAAVRKVGIPRGQCARLRRSGERVGEETGGGETEEKQGDEETENQQDPEGGRRDETRVRG